MPEAPGIRTWRLIATEYSLDCDDPALAHKLSYMIPRAEQDFPVLARYDYRVRRIGDRIEQTENGTPLPPQGSPDEALAALYDRCYRLAVAPLRGVTRLHAGLGRVGGRRFLLHGQKGAGKTTIMTRLLLDGAAIEGDELTLIEDGLATALPRRFHLKPGFLRQLPELAALADRLPFYGEDARYRVHTLDPVEAGHAWRIGRGPVDDVFVMVPAHGGATRLESLPKYEVVRRLMADCIAPLDGRGDWIGELARLVDGTRCWLLHNGSVAETSRAVMTALSH